MKSVQLYILLANMYIATAYIASDIFWKIGALGTGIVWLCIAIYQQKTNKEE
jgi:hypothetical protein